MTRCMTKTSLLFLTASTLVATWACGNFGPSDPELGAEVTIEMPDGSLVTGRVAQPTAASEPGVEAEATVQPASPAAPPSAPEPVNAEPQFTSVEVPTGTTLSLILDSALASDVSQVEDPVRARVERSVTVDGLLAIPEGALAYGTVTNATASGKVKGRAQLAFRFDEVDIDSDRYEIRSDALSYRADSTKTEDAKKIGIGAGAGALIGGLLGGKKGAGAGAAIGGGAGTAVVLTTAVDEVELRPGTPVEVSLTQPLVVLIPTARHTSGVSSDS